MRNTLLGVIAVLLACILGLGIYGYIQFREFKKDTKKQIHQLTLKASELKDDLSYFALKYEDDIVAGVKEESNVLKAKAINYADSLRVEASNYLNNLKIKE